MTTGTTKRGTIEAKPRSRAGGGASRIEIVDPAALIDLQELFGDYARGQIPTLGETQRQLVEKVVDRSARRGWSSPRTPISYYEDRMAFDSRRGLYVNLADVSSAVRTDEKARLSPTKKEKATSVLKKVRDAFFKFRFIGTVVAFAALGLSVYHDGQLENIKRANSPEGREEFVIDDGVGLHWDNLLTGVMKRYNDVKSDFNEIKIMNDSLRRLANHQGAIEQLSRQIEEFSNSILAPADHTAVDSVLPARKPNVVTAVETAARSFEDFFQSVSQPTPSSPRIRR